MNELFLCGIPVLLVLFWRTSYDFGRERGRETGMMGIAGGKMLLMDTYALSLVKGMKYDFAKDEYNFRNGRIYAEQVWDWNSYLKGHVSG